MQIYPAIDLRGGQCVRLRQGDYEQETVFSTDPAAMAKRWVEQGATFLHLVDLDGAKEGQPVNGPSVHAITQAAGVPCQLGGGLRTREHVAAALAWGVNRVVIGTKALQSPEWLAEIANEFPHQVVLGIDARDGRVATQGWLQVSDVPAIELAKRFEHLPLAEALRELRGIEREALDELQTHIETMDEPTVAYKMVTVQTHRPVSDAIAQRLGIRHETPQAILLRDGKAVWNASHFRITSTQLDQIVSG